MLFVVAVEVDGSAQGAPLGRFCPRRVGRFCQNLGGFAQGESLSGLHGYRLIEQNFTRS